jgi:hypothetical protein
MAKSALNAIDCARNAQPSRENRSAPSRKAEMNRRIRRGISCAVPVFPPAPPVTITVDGRTLAVYVGARILRGRVYAPISLVRMLVDRMWVEDSVLVVERNGRRARVPFSLRFEGDLDVSSVAVAPLLRALGDDLRYQSTTRTLDVRSPSTMPVVSASPMGQRPLPAKPVFTPEPVATPRPVWSGSPVPRRTPLPAPTLKPTGLRPL